LIYGPPVNINGYLINIPGFDIEIPYIYQENNMYETPLYGTVTELDYNTDRF
jgi:hypothetical protein